MKKKCPNCFLVNFPTAEACARCSGVLVETMDVGGRSDKRRGGLIRRAIICVLVIIFSLFGFYLSLIGSADSLNVEQKRQVAAAIAVLRERGFGDDVFLLEHFTAYRASDNWLNASVPKENAYAATNFPFEIMTIYPEFFTYPADDIERAAILLHESRHLRGYDEKGAYEYVWKNRRKLGWTKERYAASPLWQNVRRQTKENAAYLFICEGSELGDCTE